MSQIRKMREKAGLTQGELARKIGVSEITIRKWERGERNPRVKVLKKMATHLKCRAGELLD